MNEINTIYRIYNPDECDSFGVPNDWETCTWCSGSGDLGAGDVNPPGAAERITCLACWGHGSLKAAILFQLSEMVALSGHDPCGGTGVLKEVWPPGDVGDECHCVTNELRCSGCGHPYAVDPEWEGDGVGPYVVQVADYDVLGWAQDHLRAGREPPADRVNWSRCDTRCTHPGPVRFRLQGTPEWGHLGPAEFSGETVAGFPNPWRSVGIMLVGERAESVYEAQASWRPVDVRVGMIAKGAGLKMWDGCQTPFETALVARPFDLRMENIAILCLRCWAT